MTDGMENASREWSHPRVKALIEQQTRDYQRQFLYLGADQDAIEVGASIGVSAAMPLNGRGKVRQAMAASAADDQRHRSAKMARATCTCRVDGLLTRAAGRGGRRPAVRAQFGRGDVRDGGDEGGVAG